MADEEDDDSDVRTVSIGSLDSDDFRELAREDNPEFPDYDEIVSRLDLDMDAIERDILDGKPIYIPDLRPPTPRDIITNSTSGSEPYDTDEEREKDAKYANQIIMASEVTDLDLEEKVEQIEDLPGYKSVRSILRERLNRFSGGIKISRVVYLFSYSSGLFELSIAESMKALVDDLNIHLGEDKLTGVLLYTGDYAVNMVEGSEYAIINHFKGLINTPVQERIIDSKILTVAPHVIARWVNNWSVASCNFLVKPEDDIEVGYTEGSAAEKDLDIDTLAVLKCENAWKYVAAKQVEGEVVEYIPSDVTPELPSLQHVNFCLKEENHLTIEEYIELITTVPDFRDFHEHNTPAQGDEIPMNILNPSKEEEEALMQSMIMKKTMEREAKRKKPEEEVKEEAPEADEEEEEEIED